MKRHGFRLAPPGAYRVDLWEAGGAWAVQDILLFGHSVAVDADRVGRVAGSNGMDPCLANWSFSDLGRFVSKEEALEVCRRWINRHRDLTAWWVPSE